MKNTFHSSSVGQGADTVLILELPYTTRLNYGLIDTCSHNGYLLTCRPVQETAFVAARYRVGDMPTVSALIRAQQFSPYQAKCLVLQMARLIATQEKAQTATMLMDAEHIYWDTATDSARFISVPTEAAADMEAELKEFLSGLFGSRYLADDRVRQTVAMQCIRPDFTAGGLISAVETGCADIIAGQPGLLARLFGKKSAAARKQDVPPPISDKKDAAPASRPAADGRAAYSAYASAGAPADVAPAPSVSVRSAAPANFQTKLIILQGPEKSYTITGFPCILGRSEEQATCVIAGPGISRVHASIFLQGGLPYLQDENSKYGTSVDGVAVSGSMSVPLRPGAVICLARTNFIVTSIKGK